MLRTFSFSALLISLGFAACGGSSTPAATQPTPTAAAADDPSCPVTVAGTSVTAEDTNTGAALVFVTTGDVAELRKRVATMATMHNEQHAAMGPLPTGDEPGGGSHEHHGAGHASHATGSGGGAHAGHAGGMIAVHSKAAAEHIEGGARFVLVAFPDGVAKLQSELRTHAQHLGNGSCKMDHH